MTPSSACIALIKEFEGCKLTAYKDVAGVWTIGWGHTGPDVIEGVEYTQAQADGMLQDDILEAASHVSSVVKVALTQGQFDALAQPSTAGHVAVVNPDQEQGPQCPVCGAMMVRRHEVGWQCLSCGNEAPDPQQASA